MKNILFIIIFITLSCSKQKTNKSTDMEIVRGLQPAISKFNDFEQKLIEKTIKKMSKGSYFQDKVTAIEIKKNIKDITKFYKTNAIKFYINPHVIGNVGWRSGMEKFCYYAIEINWKTQNCNRGVNDDNITFTKHIMELNERNYQIPDTRLKPFIKSIDEQDRILKKVNEVFIKGKSVLKRDEHYFSPYKPILLEDFKYFSSKNLYELAKDYFVVIKDIKTVDGTYIKDTYTLIISKEDRLPYVGEKKRPLHPKKGIILTVNIETSEIIDLEYEYMSPPALL